MRNALALLKEKVAAEREVVADVVALIAEVDAEGLYRHEACPSMFVFCVERLHLSEDAAYKRIQVARLSRRLPQVLDYLASGKIHLTGLNCLASHLNDANCDELLERASYKSKKQIEELCVVVTPKPDMPVVVRKLPQPVQIQLAPAQVPVRKIVPLAPERYGIQFTASKATKAKLDRAKELLRTQDLEAVIDQALALLIAEVEKKRFGKTDKARKAKPQQAGSRYVPREVKREVFERDGGQCTFRDLFDRRCSERATLEYDHIRPYGLGGESTAENLRLLCRAHNQLAAEEVYGHVH